MEAKADDLKGQEDPGYGPPESARGQQADRPNANAVKENKGYLSILLVVNVLLVCIVIILAVVIAAQNPATTGSEAEGAAVLMKTNEPSLPGIMGGTDKPKILIAQDVDYPPYAFLDDKYNLGGFGKEMADGVAKACDWDLTQIQTTWADCWGKKMGPGLQAGNYHACNAYTHTKGARNRMMDFSWGYIKNNAAGLLARLDSQGKPVLTGNDPLSNKKVADVRGWAPEEDGLQYVTNTCTGAAFDFANIQMSSPGGFDGKNINDVAITQLLAGTVDAVWIFANQANTYNCAAAKAAGQQISWDCDGIWSKFGEPNGFAYIHTGMMDHAVNGTALTMSRKGSGLNDIVNPCLQKFMEQKEYYDLCKKHDLVDSCYTNKSFPTATASTTDYWNQPTNKLTSSCSDGYCPCSS